MRLRQLRRLAGSILVCLMGALLMASVSPARSLVVHLKFKRIAAGSGVVTDGRYVLELATLSEAGVWQGPARLLDEQTGKMRILGTCENRAAFGGRWLWWPSCADSLPMPEAFFYDLKSRQTKQVNVVDPNCQAISGTPTCDIGPAGSDWLTVTPLCSKCSLAPPSEAQNISTGYVRSFPNLNSRQVIDLDSRNLVSPICKPWTRSHGWLVVHNLGGAPIGSAILASAPKGTTYVERCGTRRRARVPFAIETVNAEAVLSRARTTLPGMTLQSFRRFVIPLPTQLRRADFILTNRKLWVATFSGQLWAAAFPRIR